MFSALIRAIVSQADGRSTVVWWYAALSALYYFPFIIEGLELVGYALFYGIPLFYLCLNYRSVKKVFHALINDSLKYVVAIFFVFALACLLPALLLDTFDMSLFDDSVIRVAKEGLRLLFLMVVFMKHISPRCDWRLFVKYFIWANMLYVAGTCIMLAIPGLREGWYAIVKDTEHARLVALYPEYFTRYGWMGFTGFGQTFRCTVALVLQCFFLAEHIKKIRLSEFVPIIVMLLGTLLYGRIGFLVSLLILGVFFICCLFKQRPRLVCKIGAVLVLLCVALAIASIFVEGIRTWLDWALALFVNFFATGSFSDGSTDMLFNDMFFMPELHTLLFGDGLYTYRGTYYMETDSGIMRPLLYGGIGFMLLRYVLILSLLFYAFQESRRRKSAAGALLVVLICITLVLFEIKGEVVVSCFLILFPLATMYAVHQRVEKQGELHD